MTKRTFPLLAVTTAALAFGIIQANPVYAFGLPFVHHKNAQQEQSQDQTKPQPATTSPATDSTTTAAPVTAQPEAQPTPKVQVQSPLTDEENSLKVEEPVESTVIPPDKSFVAIDDPTNPLGISVSAKKLDTSADLITQKKYKEAEKVIVPLKDWLVDATEAHISLYKTLKEIPSAQVQAELEKQLGLQFALLRDKAFLQLGLLGIGEKDYSIAVKNLTRVIQSQPRSAMGVQAYEVLQNIGFTEKLQIREDKKPGASTPSSSH